MYPDIICMNNVFSRSTTRIVANSAHLEVGQGKTNTFYFTDGFCCFRLNKSALETAETKQADSQLYSAPKIIKIPLLVFENELIEDAILVPKSLKTENSCFSHV